MLEWIDNLMHMINLHAVIYILNIQGINLFFRNNIF